MTRVTETTDIAIVGGGICGLTTALALEQRGLSPTVYEAASEYRPVGAGILLQTNALLVFDRLGIVDRIRSIGVPLDDARILSPRGRLLQRFDLDALERTQFEYGYVAIHRSDLQGILLEELDADIRMDKTCAEIEETAPPTARFEDGTRIHPDLLVGADGIDSTVRGAVAPDTEVQTLDTPVYRALATCELPERHRARGLEVWGEGTYTGGAPIDADRFYWFATAPDQLVARTPASTDLMERIRRYYGTFPEPVPTVIDAIEAEDIVTTGLADVPPLDHWSRGSVVLAGDAAHGMLPFAGQGAAQAIEDALTLATTLDVYADHRTAIDAYEGERKQRADRVRRESGWLGALGTSQSNLVCRARNLAVDLLPSSVFSRLRRERLTDTSLPAAVTTDSTA